MIMKIVYPDGTWFIGERNQKAMGYLYNHETKGTHHYFVLDYGTVYELVKGQEVAIPINSVKYFVLDYFQRVRLE